MSSGSNRSSSPEGTEAGNLKGELLRKGIHLTGLSYIPFYLLTDRFTTLAAVAFLTLVAIFVEIFRRRSRVVPELILRGYERRGVGAHVYFGISMLTVTLLFPPHASFVAVACGAAGDGVAGIVKKIRREHAAPSMFLASMLVLAVLSITIGLSIPAAFLAAVTATLVESKLGRIGKYYINDNLSVPLVAAAVYQVAALTFKGYA